MRYIFAFLLINSLALQAQTKFDQAKLSFRTEPALSISLLEEYVQEKLSDTEYAKAFYALSYLYHYNEYPLEKALEAGFKGLTYFDQLSDKEGEEKTLRHISQIHLKAGNFIESREYSALALTYETNPNKAAQNHHNLGIANKFLGNFDEASQHYAQSITYYEGENDQNKVCELIIELGLVQFYKGNYPLSIDQYNKAYDKANEWKLLEWQAKALNNIGNAYLALGERELAKRYLSKSINMNIIDDQLQLVSMYNIAKLYFDDRQLDSANFYVMRAINSYSNLHDLPQYFDAMDLRKQIAIAGMNIDSAMFYLNKQSELAKELMSFRTDLQRRNTMLLASWKESQRRNLELKNFNRKILEQRNFLIIGGIILLGIVFWVGYRFRVKTQ